MKTDHFDENFYHLENRISSLANELWGKSVEEQYQIHSRWSPAEWNIVGAFLNALLIAVFMCNHPSLNFIVFLALFNTNFNWIKIRWEMITWMTKFEEWSEFTIFHQLMHTRMVNIELWGYFSLAFAFFWGQFVDLSNFSRVELSFYLTWPRFPFDWFTWLRSPPPLIGCLLANVELF